MFSSCFPGEQKADNDLDFSYFASVIPHTPPHTPPPHTPPRVSLLRGAPVQSWRTLHRVSGGAPGCFSVLLAKALVNNRNLFTRKSDG